MMTNRDLDRLNELLLSIPIDADGMLLSEFDGFCAGLIVSPEVIKPSEWLPLVWGDEGLDAFPNLESVQEITDLIMRHYNDVAGSLLPTHVEYGPLFDEDTRNGDILWESWVCGFEQAMRLRSEAWAGIVESGDEEASACVNMLLALYNIAEAQSDLPKKSVRDLMEQAPDLIPDLVVTLNAWTKGQEAPEPYPSMLAANRPQVPFSGQKVGRNEPCPCGSGRKYKRCCGTN